MTEAEFFSRQVSIMLTTRRNKRRGKDSVAFEANWVPLLVRGMDERLARTLRIRHNYTFLVSRPKWREIFATEYAGRMIDHEICEIVLPLCEKVLSPYTYNNRKGKGSQAAINQLIENIFEVTEGYTQPARIIKLDFKGYFPSALWTYAEQCLRRVLDTATEDDLKGYSRDYLEWLIMIAVHANPAGHYERRTPAYLWRDHISPEKSLLTKPEGEGAAIGRLIWQTVMGLYVNDDILWLTNECGLKVVCFVDDIVMVVPERLHGYALSLIPELRKRLAAKNIRINEKKFYDQPYGNGCEFLGSHLKPFRLHLNNKTYERAQEAIGEMNTLDIKDIDKMVECFNSYSGLLKNRTDYWRLLALRDRLDNGWWRRLRWNDARHCLAYREGFTPNERLIRKYRITLKKKRHEKSRTA